MSHFLNASAAQAALDASEITLEEIQQGTHTTDFYGSQRRFIDIIPDLSGFSLLPADLEQIAAEGLLNNLQLQVDSLQQKIAGLEGATIESFNTHELKIHAGGTHNWIVYSPNGAYLVAFSDVGGVRYYDGKRWRYLPTNGTNAGRQIAGGCVTNDGIIYLLCGFDAGFGILQKIDIMTGELTDLVTGLHVRANKISEGDTGSRPRPVGQMVVYNDSTDTLYYSTENGIGRYSGSSDDGIIALAGESCRGFAHQSHGIIDSDTLDVTTRTKGLVRILDASSSPKCYRVSPTYFARFEDAAYLDVDAGSLIAAGHTQGVYRYLNKGSITLNGESITSDASIPTDITSERYALEVEAILDWSSTDGELIGAWGATDADQTIRLRMVAGVLQFSVRHAGGEYTLNSDAAMPEGYERLCVRYRPTSATIGVLEKKAHGGDWQQIGSGAITVYPSGNPVPLAIGALPTAAQIYRASMTKLGDSEPAMSIDLTGVFPAATEATGVSGDTWTWPTGVTVNPGGGNITPVTGNGANGSPIRWTCVATRRTSTATAIAGCVNPKSATQWMFRLSNADISATWEDATPTPATLLPGSENNTPPNRMLGQSAASGPDLTGVYAIKFDLSDTTASRVIASCNLSLYVSENIRGDASAIAWKTFNPDLSMHSISCVHVDSEGYVYAAGADHNISIFSPDTFLTDEPVKVPVSGIQDGWSVHSIGSGAGKLVAFCAVSDTDPNHASADVYFFQGTGLVSNWVSTGYAADLITNGNVPRPTGIRWWDNGDGTAGLVAQADGLGFVHSTFNGSSFSPWTVQESGPTTDLVTDNQLQERQIAGSENGSVFFAVQLKTGQIWRCTDKGKNWASIASAIGTAQEARAGRIAYIESQDILIASDAGALYRIDNASTSADVTQIADITVGSMLSVNSSDDAYVHLRGSVGRLVQFDDFANATRLSDGKIISDDSYDQRVADLATGMTFGTILGNEYGFIAYQGAGLLAIQYSESISAATKTLEFKNDNFDASRNTDYSVDARGGSILVNAADGESYQDEIFIFDEYDICSDVKTIAINGFMQGKQDIAYINSPGGWIKLTWLSGNYGYKVERSMRETI